MSSSSNVDDKYVLPSFVCASDPKLTAALLGRYVIVCAEYRDS